MTPETLRLTNLPPAPRYWPYANLVSSFPLEIRRQSRPRFSFWHDWKKILCTQNREVPLLGGVRCVALRERVLLNRASFSQQCARLSSVPSESPCRVLYRALHYCGLSHTLAPRSTRLPYFRDTRRTPPNTQRTSGQPYAALPSSREAGTERHQRLGTHDWGGVVI